MSDTIVTGSETDSDKVFVQTSPDAVTREIVMVDGCQDSVAVTYSPWAGASSEAPLSAGVPSARMQRTGGQLSMEPTIETTLGDRVQSVQQDLKP